MRGDCGHHQRQHNLINMSTGMSNSNSSSSNNNNNNNNNIGAYHG